MEVEILIFASFLLEDHFINLTDLRSGVNPDTALGPIRCGYTRSRLGQIQ